MNHELPDWVWTLVIGIDTYEDEHAKDAGCIDYLLDAIPAEAKLIEAARAEGYAAGSARVEA